MKMAKNLKKINKGIDAVVISYAKEYESEIIDLNTEQLYQGIDSNGEDISPPYRPMTISIKQGLGQPTNRVTLKDEGDFYDGFFVNYGNDWFALGSDDEKAQKLEKKYGADIYGLTDKSKEDLVSYFKEDMIKDIQAMISKGLGIKQTTSV